MNIYVSILFIVFLLNFYAIFSVTEIKIRPFKTVCIILLSFCLLRYISLFTFYVSKAPGSLYMIKNLPLISQLAIPLVSFIIIKLLNKGGLSKVDSVFIILMTVVYMLIIYKAPCGIKPVQVGYQVMIDRRWGMIASIAQGIFYATMIYLSISYFVICKSIKLKILNILFCIGYIAATTEGLLMLLEIHILPWFIISEGIILLFTSVGVKLNS